VQYKLFLGRVGLSLWRFVSNRLNIDESVLGNYIPSIISQEENSFTHTPVGFPTGVFFALILREEPCEFLAEPMARSRPGL